MLLKGGVKRMTNIGEYIKERRKALGMSQDELAEKMGYKNRSTIAKIEKGVNDVTQTNIVKFAEVLRTTPAYLMGWVETEKKNNAIADIVIRLRTDEDFLYLVESMGKLDTEKLKAFKQLVSTLL